MSEKRRAGVLVSGSSSSSGCEADQEFVSRSGVSALLAGALLRLLDCRSGDPLGFLAEHFAHLSAEAEEGGAEQRSLSRALWMLSLQHHSQRSAFNSSVRVSMICCLSAVRVLVAWAGGSTRRRCRVCAVKAVCRPPLPLRCCAAYSAVNTRPCPSSCTGRPCSPAPCSQTTSASPSVCTQRWRALQTGRPRGHCAARCWRP
nr:Zgc:92789 [Danio rerio]